MGDWDHKGKDQWDEVTDFNGRQNVMISGHF